MGFEDEQIMTDEQIRDTVDHLSSITDFKEGEIPKRITFMWRSTHDQPVKLQFQGDRLRNFALNLAVGDEITIPAGNVTPATGYATLTNFFPFMRVRAVCDDAPDSGAISIWQEAYFEEER